MRKYRSRKEKSKRANMSSFILRGTKSFVLLLTFRKSCELLCYGNFVDWEVEMILSAEVSVWLKNVLRYQSSSVAGF